MQCAEHDLPVCTPATPPPCTLLQEPFRGVWSTHLTWAPASLSTPALLVGQPAATRASGLTAAQLIITAPREVPAGGSRQVRNRHQACSSREDAWQGSGRPHEWIHVQVVLACSSLSCPLQLFQQTLHIADCPSGAPPASADAWRQQILQQTWLNLCAPLPVVSLATSSWRSSTP